MQVGLDGRQVQIPPLIKPVGATGVVLEIWRVVTPCTNVHADKSFKRSEIEKTDIAIRKAT
jgi:hypothetical protein